MRDFLLNSENTLDEEQIDYLNRSGQKVLLPCRWIWFNDRIKLAFFPDGCVPLGDACSALSLNDACAVLKELISEVRLLEKLPQMTPENLVLDVDSLYLDEEKMELRALYLPVTAEEEIRNSRIYVRRVYAVLEELLERTDDGETVIRQINFQKEQAPGDWELLKEALDKREAVQNETITLRGTGKNEGRVFTAGHEDFLVGSDGDKAALVLDAADSVEPEHAMIGWNEISFYVIDFNTQSGTFVNDTRISPRTQIPIGPGSVIRFGDTAFVVE